MITMLKTQDNLKMKLKLSTFVCIGINNNFKSGFTFSTLFPLHFYIIST